MRKLYLFIFYFLFVPFFVFSQNNLERNFSFKQNCKKQKSRTKKQEYYSNLIFGISIEQMKSKDIEKRFSQDYELGKINKFGYSSPLGWVLGYGNIWQIEIDFFDITMGHNIGDYEFLNGEFGVFYFK